MVLFWFLETGRQLFLNSEKPPASSPIALTFSLSLFFFLFAFLFLSLFGFISMSESLQCTGKFYKLPSICQTNLGRFKRSVSLQHKAKSPSPSASSSSNSRRWVWTCWLQLLIDLKLFLCLLFLCMDPEKHSSSQKRPTPPLRLPPTYSSGLPSRSKSLT